MAQPKISTSPAKLTTALVESLPSTGARYELFDSELPGLHLRVSQSGAKTYAFRYRNAAGVRRRDNIGRHPAITTDQARRIAKGKAGDVAKGGDPQADKREARRRGVGTPTLRTFIEGPYLEWAAANRRSGEQTARRLLAVLPTDLLDKKLPEVNAWTIQKWQATKLKAGAAPATVDRNIAALRAVLTHAAIAGHVEKNALSGFKLSRPDNRRIRYLSEDEEKRLRAALIEREREIGRADHLRPLTLLALNTGCRRGELLGLTWRAVDLGRQLMTVEAHTAKSAKTRHVPLNAEAVEVLRKWKPKDAEGLVFGGLTTIKRSWRGLMKRAKIKNFAFHDCRHTFASRLVMAGVSLAVVRDLLGHSTIAMAERYAHLAPDAKVEAVALLGTSR